MKVRKQTGDRVSRIAARVLRGRAKPDYVFYFGNDDMIYLSEIRAMAGSLLAQDETKGKRPKRRATK